MAVVTRNWRDPGAAITIASIDNALDDIAAASAALDGTNLEQGAVGVEHFIADRGASLLELALPINRAMNYTSQSGAPPAPLLTLSSTAWTNLTQVDMPATNAVLTDGNMLRWIWSVLIGEVTTSRSNPPVETEYDNIYFRVRVEATSSAGTFIMNPFDDEALGIIHVMSMTSGSSGIFQEANVDLPFRRISGEWEYLHDEDTSPWGGTGPAQILTLYLDARLQSAVVQEAEVLSAQIIGIIAGSN